MRNNLLIPAILSIIILVIAINVFIPIEQARALHGEIIQAFEAVIQETVPEVLDPISGDVADLDSDHDQMLDEIAALPIVPIGTVLDWFCVDPCTIPDGYALADGSIVDDPESPFFDVTLPDLRESFVRGAATTDDVGDTGGSPGGHTHSVDPPNTETTQDSHNHELVGASSTPSAIDNDSPPGCTDIFNLGLCNQLSTSNHRHSAGTHSINDVGHSHTVDVLPSDSASSDGLPPFVDLLKIIRIK